MASINAYSADGLHDNHLHHWRQACFTLGAYLLSWDQIDFFNDELNDGYSMTTHFTVVCDGILWLESRILLQSGRHLFLLPLKSTTAMC